MNILNGSLYAIYKYNSFSADMLESGLRTGSGCNICNVLLVLYILMKPV
jgi:hypothetical protein